MVELINRSARRGNKYSFKSQSNGRVARAVDKFYDAVQDRERFDRQQFIKYMRELQSEFR